MQLQLRPPLRLRGRLRRGKGNLVRKLELLLRMESSRTALQLEERGRGKRKLLLNRVMLEDLVQVSARGKEKEKLLNLLRRHSTRLEEVVAEAEEVGVPERERVKREHEHERERMVEIRELGRV